MTKQEVIEYLKTGIEERKNNNIALSTISVLELAISALEKQIPIVPSKVNNEALKLDGIFDWCCGKCGTHHRNDFLLNYCSECGQAVKWE